MPSIVTADEGPYARKNPLLNYTSCGTLVVVPYARNPYGRYWPLGQLSM